MLSSSGVCVCAVGERERDKETVKERVGVYMCVH